MVEVVGNADRARSKLLLMKRRQLEDVAKRHNISLYGDGKKHMTRKDMACALAHDVNVINELG